MLPFFQIFMKILREKGLLSLSVLTILKWLIEIKTDINFYFHTSLWCLEKVFSFLDMKKNSRNKKFNHFIPLFRIGATRVKTVFVELPTYAISVSLTIEIHKNNIDTSTVTNKQYYKKYFSKIFYQPKLAFRELLPNTTDFLQGNFTRKYFFLSQTWSYSKSLLTGISANSTSRRVFDLEKLKIIYSSDVYYFLFMITSICFSQVSLTEQKWTLLRTNTC